LNILSKFNTSSSYLTINPFTLSNSPLLEKNYVLVIQSISKYIIANNLSFWHVINKNPSVVTYLWPIFILFNVIDGLDKNDYVLFFILKYCFPIFWPVALLSYKSAVIL